MGLDITIKQDGKEVYSNNFYGFIYFSDTNSRHTKAAEMKPELVKDYKTYRDFICRAVEPDRRKQYLERVDKYGGRIEVVIW